MKEYNYCPLVQATKHSINVALYLNTNLVYAIRAFQETKEFLRYDSLRFHQSQYKVYLVAHSLSLYYVEVFVVRPK